MGMQLNLRCPNEENNIIGIKMWKTDPRRTPSERGPSVYTTVRTLFQPLGRNLACRNSNAIVSPCSTRPCLHLENQP